MKKNFTKVIAMFIMFSLLSGCSGKQTQKVDEKALHYCSLFMKILKEHINIQFFMMARTQI